MAGIETKGGTTTINLAYINSSLEQLIHEQYLSHTTKLIISGQIFGKKNYGSPIKKGYDLSSPDFKHILSILLVHDIVESITISMFLVMKLK